MSVTADWGATAAVLIVVAVAGVLFWLWQRKRSSSNGGGDIGGGGGDSTPDVRKPGIYMLPLKGGTFSEAIAACARAGGRLASKAEALVAAETGRCKDVVSKKVMSAGYVADGSVYSPRGAGVTSVPTTPKFAFMRITTPGAARARKTDRVMIGFKKGNAEGKFLGITATDARSKKTKITPTIGVQATTALVFDKVSIVDGSDFVLVVNRPRIFRGFVAFVTSGSPYLSIGRAPDAIPSPAGTTWKWNATTGVVSGTGPVVSQLTADTNKLGSIHKSDKGIPAKDKGTAVVFQKTT